MFCTMYIRMQLEDKAKCVEFERRIDETFWKEHYKEDDYDENGMNLFHYCVWKDHHSTMKKLAECGYGKDINSFECDLAIVYELLEHIQLLFRKCIFQ